MTKLKRTSYDLSLEQVVVGVRGGGKTLFMTHLECEALRQAFAVRALRSIRGERYLPRRKVNVWSNYPVRRVEKIGGRPVYLASQELDIEKLIIWHPDFKDGIIFFDEIDQVADRQDWYSTVSKMLNAGVQVMRHRNLTLVISIQSLNWLNARLQWQADTIIQCRDLAFTPWGRRQDLDLGEVMKLSIIDKSGILTGRSYEEYPRVYEQLFFGKRYWNNYSSWHEFDITEGKTIYKLKKSVKEIDLTGGEKETERAQYLDILRQAIEYFKYNNPGEEVRSDVFWQTAIGFGFPERQKQIGGVMLHNDLGVDRRESRGRVIYSFDEARIYDEA